MLILKGTLVTVFKTPKGEDKDGNKYGGDEKLQILNNTATRDGELKHELIDITVKDSSFYRERVGDVVELPVSVTTYKNKIYYADASI